jgi:DNA-binding CsgD family transcriptional regulator
MNINYSGMFQILDNIGENEINIDNYDFIPTVKYRDIIAKLCAEINEVESLHTYCPAVVMNNGTMFYTSNDPNYSAIYVTSGLYRADNYFSKAHNHNDHFLITSGYYGDYLQHSVIDILQIRFKVYNSFCLIRRCDDCTLIVAISHNNHLQYPEQVYQRSVNLIEDFTVKYFDCLISLYVDNLPGLKYSRFATDSRYRAAVIRKREARHKKPLLTTRESECIHWISRGKTSKEISQLMRISEYTVNEHKKKIMRKLNVSNIVFAVREALRAEIIT